MSIVAPEIFSVAASAVFPCAGKSFSGSARSATAAIETIRLRRRNPMNERLTSALVGCSSRGSRGMFLAIGEDQRVERELAGAKNQNQQRDQQERKSVV